MTLHIETQELQIGIVNLQSKLQHLSTLFVGLIALMQAHIHGISKVSLIRNIIVVSLAILGSSFLIASLRLLLYLSAIDQKIWQITNLAKKYIRWRTPK